MIIDWPMAFAELLVVILIAWILAPRGHWRRRALERFPDRETCGICGVSWNTRDAQHGRLCSLCYRAVVRLHPGSVTFKVKASDVEKLWRAIFEDKSDDWKGKS